MENVSEKQFFIFESACKLTRRNGAVVTIATNGNMSKQKNAALQMQCRSM
jgi:hypothetical protein